MSEIIASIYELREKLGSGGGGTVYLANHLRLDKKVVLKEDKRKLSTRPELLRREVDILKNLSHSYIPQVYDFFVENERVYIVMEYIEGESLDRPLNRGEKFSQPRVIKWGMQLLEALCYLHNPTHGEPPRGYVHSDIKPANLMRTPYDDICLIDFNIALAIGEENVVGCSAGYASPEHYGYDFSSGSETATMKEGTFYEETAYMEDGTETLPLSVPQSSLSGRKEEGVSNPFSQSGSSSGKVVVPDARSDIYSVGATLYHLLSGKRPARHAKEVAPLSGEEFSPQIVAIIAKAMDPNPDLRYQTAEEMLDAFAHLRENDPRVRKERRIRRAVSAVIGGFCVLGVCSAFLGLRRMQVTESWLKLAEYSANSLTKGDSVSAIGYALQALPEKSGLLMPQPLPQAQTALTDALGVYELSDGFKPYKTVQLPSEPLYLAIAPDGKTGACVCAGSVTVFDTDTAEILAALPGENSALAEVDYLNSHAIVYAGADGIRAYDIAKKEELWKGEPATAISVSQDGRTVAAVYKEETFATVYDAASGQVRTKVDFDGKSQRISINENFASLNENVFALNGDGTLLGVSFADGSLRICDLQDDAESILVLEEGSGCTHLEGGFFQKYFAFGATKPSGSVYAVIDAQEKRQMGGFQADRYCGVQTDGDGIYVQSDNILVKMDPVTGEQEPLVVTSGNIAHFAHSNDHTLIASDEGVLFFGANAELISRREDDGSSDFVQIAGGTALTGSLDSPVVSILKYENHAETELFAYDPLYEHDEARISADGKTVMLFSYKQFRIYEMDGTLAADVVISDAGQVYDQQYVRNEEGSFLEVTYNDGTVATYDGADGTLLGEEAGDEPDMSLNEEFFTDTLRIESPLHGTAVAYDKNSGRFIKELEKDAYLTYVTQVGDYIVTQYVAADGDSYGILLNEKCETLAYLPCLCDIVDGELIFDYPTGNLRKAPLYELEELVELAGE